MRSLFWSGKLTFPMKLLVERNNLLSLFTGSSRDLAGMKECVKKGYEGEFSDHVHHYDESKRVIWRDKFEGGGAAYDFGDPS